jgi:hypothetical protein
MIIKSYYPDNGVISKFIYLKLLNIKERDNEDYGLDGFPVSVIVQFVF